MDGFQRLLAWRVAAQLADDLDRITRGPQFRGAYALADQLRRASISAVSNIAEGHGRARRAEFAKFLLIARGSGVEVQAQLVLALGMRRLSYAEYARLRGMADHVVALITKLHSIVLTQEERG
ncbi:MAG TPA: four helix bundle protein [Gemmatimonadales bacterium]|nr:four helix bundle protein [Gemmatimonadales bacterium]